MNETWIAVKPPENTVGLFCKEADTLELNDALQKKLEKTFNK